MQKPVKKKIRTSPPRLPVRAVDSLGISSVKVGFLDFAIQEKDVIKFNGMDVSGLYDRENQIIEIHGALPPQQKVQVLLHEILHAVCDNYNIDLTEPENDLLAVGIASLLRDNIPLITSLLKKLDT